MVKIDMLETPYGPVSSKLNFAKLSELTVPKIGIQTGPFGSQLHQDEYVDDGTPIITVEHLGENRIVHENLPKVSNDDKKRLNRYIINKGDIVFSRVGSVDRRSLVREEEDGWMFSGRCLRVRVDPGILDPTYLSYFFGVEGFKKYIRAVAVGATMPSINTQILSEIPIYYPSLQIQLKISAVLSALDDKIELNRQMNRTLEQMARALFKSWFIDFDPVHAKQRGEQPAGMDAETAALFPDRFVEIDGKEVPEGWEWTRLDGILEMQRGFDLPTEQRQEGSIPVVSAGGFHGFHSVSRVSAPGVVTGRSGVIGKVFFVSEDFWPLNTTLWVKKLDGIGANYAYELLNTINYQNFSAGSAVPTLNRNHLHCLEVIRPNSDVAQAFENAVEQWRSLIVKNESEISTLSSLRDSLLPRLLSGELDVSDWEDAVEAPEGAPA